MDEEASDVGVGDCALPEGRLQREMYGMGLVGSADVGSEFAWPEGTDDPHPMGGRWLVGGGDGSEGCLGLGMTFGEGWDERGRCRENGE